jgi:gas vesicle protein
MTERIDSNAGYFLAGLTIGSLISIFFAPKSGEGTRAYLSKKVNEGSEQARKKARELRARAEDLVDSGKELINEKKEQIAAKLEEAGEDYPPEKSKAKGV